MDVTLGVMKVGVMYGEVGEGVMDGVDVYVAGSNVADGVPVGYIVGVEQ